MIETFNEFNHSSLCDVLAASDPDLQNIIKRYGYPPVWTRSPDFASLIHIILEQQVSLASALAAFHKLKNAIGNVTPENLLRLSDEEMRACYFSRQKTVYARSLALAITNNQLDLEKLPNLPNEEIREMLRKVKGIGDWTVDIYLLFALQRTDIFPIGDLAMVNAMRDIKNLSSSTSREELIAIAEAWRPYRSVATYLLWHYYLSKRRKQQ